MCFTVSCWIPEIHCDWNEREIHWGLFYNTLDKKGLNLRLGNGRGSVNEETKQQISKSLLGKKKTKEHCKNISKNTKGKKLSNETKKRIVTVPVELAQDFRSFSFQTPWEEHNIFPN